MGIKDNLTDGLKGALRDGANPDTESRIAVDLEGATISVPGGIEVQLDHQAPNPDSVRIGDGTETANVNANNQLETRDNDANTSLTAINNTLGPGFLGTLLQGIQYNHITATYPDPVTEVYQYRQGGAGGTLNATITVVYTAANKKLVSTVERT